MKWHVLSLLHLVDVIVVFFCSTLFSCVSQMQRLTGSHKFGLVHNADALPHVPEMLLHEQMRLERVRAFAERKGGGGGKR